MNSAAKTQMPEDHVGILFTVFGQQFVITGTPSAIRTASEMIEHGDIGDKDYDADEIASLAGDVTTSVGGGRHVTGHYCAIDAIRTLADSIGYARHRRDAFALAA